MTNAIFYSRLVNGARQRLVGHVLIGSCCGYAALLVLGGYVSLSPYRLFATVPELYRDICTKRSASSDCERDSQCIPRSGAARRMAYALSPEARVFVGDMLGPSHVSSMASYYFLNYYLLPRDVSVSLDGPARFAFDFDGRAPQSTNDLVSAGYDVLLTATPGGPLTSHPLRPLDLQERDGCRLLSRYPRDAVMAFLLPLLAASFGFPLLRMLFPGLYGTFRWGERLVFAFALGCMIAGQAFLASCLMGLGTGPVWFWGLVGLTGVLTVRSLIRHGSRMRAGAWRAYVRPASIALLPAAALFIPLLWLAGLDGLREFDAVMAWAVKAKLLYYYEGRELITQFSNPALGYAHLDYPQLVPSLMALTYRVIGEVNEFVSKFWAGWMLVMLYVGILSACRSRKGISLYAVAIASTAVFLPLSLRYARMEGGTMPMLFFATLGAVQVGLAAFEQRRDRLVLGGLMLLGAGLCKFEGLLLLVAWGAALIAIPTTRRLLRPDRQMVCGLILGGLLLAPYVAMRASIPILHPQSEWFPALMGDPVAALSAVPHVVGAYLAGQWLNEGVLRWYSPDGAAIVWDGGWLGLRSLIDLPTAGYGWLTLMLAVGLALAFSISRRTVLLLTLPPFALALGLSVIIVATPAYESSLPVLNGLSFSGDEGCGRYLSPVFIAWGLSLSVLLARVCSVDEAVAAACASCEDWLRRARLVSARTVAAGVAILVGAGLVAMLVMTRHFTLAAELPGPAVDRLIQTMRREAETPRGRRSPRAVPPIKSVTARKASDGYLVCVRFRPVPDHPEMDVRTRYFHAMLTSSAGEELNWQFREPACGLSYYLPFAHVR
ncbi:MAG: hypothetical protein K8T26_15020 [Lentisphaerae bacterium]|nr:hypothetical protein [Lentisphaerota bacterium]